MLCALYDTSGADFTIESQVEKMNTQIQRCMYLEVDTVSTRPRPSATQSPLRFTRSLGLLYNSSAYLPNRGAGGNHQQKRVTALRMGNRKRENSNPVPFCLAFADAAL